MTLPRPVVRIPIYAICTSLLFNLISTIPRIQMGMPITNLKTYLAPTIVGLITGSVLGFFYCRISQLNATLKERVDHLEKFTSLCAGCKKVKIPATEDKPDVEWIEIDKFLSMKTTLSHGVCPCCIKTLYPEQYKNLIKSGKSQMS